MVGQATLKDLITPAVAQMIDDGVELERIIEVVARGGLNHKKWRAPARRLVIEILGDIVETGLVRKKWWQFWK